MEPTATHKVDTYRVTPGCVASQGETAADWSGLRPSFYLTYSPGSGCQATGATYYRACSDRAPGGAERYPGYNGGEPRLRGGQTPRQTAKVERVGAFPPAKYRRITAEYSAGFTVRGAVGVIPRKASLRLNGRRLRRGKRVTPCTRGLLCKTAHHRNKKHPVSTRKEPE